MKLTMKRLMKYLNNGLKMIDERDLKYIEYEEIDGYVIPYIAFDKNTEFHTRKLRSLHNSFSVEYACIIRFGNRLFKEGLVIASRKQLANANHFEFILRHELAHALNGDLIFSISEYFKVLRSIRKMSRYEVDRKVETNEANADITACIGCGYEISDYIAARNELAHVCVEIHNDVFFDTRYRAKVEDYFHGDREELVKQKFNEAFFKDCSTKLSWNNTKLYPGWC